MTIPQLGVLAAAAGGRSAMTIPQLGVLAAAAGRRDDRNDTPAWGFSSRGRLPGRHGIAATAAAVLQYCHTAILPYCRILEDLPRSYKILIRS